MNSVDAITVIRDSLRSNLVDPRSLAGATARPGSYFIFSDEPSANDKFPIIQLKKLTNPTEILSIGYEYTERERLVINIWFSSKNGFKVTVGGVEYSNAQLVEYYLGLIKETFKAQFNTLFAAGDKNYKHINTTPIGFDEETQLYYAAVTVRVAYWNT